MMTDLMDNATQVHIPPPAACYPQAGDSQNTISQFEESAFSLPSATSGMNWNASFKNILTQDRYASK